MKKKLLRTVEKTCRNCQQNKTLACKACVEITKGKGDFSNWVPIQQGILSLNYHKADPTFLCLQWKTLVTLAKCKECTAYDCLNIKDVLRLELEAKSQQ